MLFFFLKYPKNSFFLWFTSEISMALGILRLKIKFLPLFSTCFTYFVGVIYFFLIKIPKQLHFLDFSSQELTYFGYFTIKTLHFAQIINFSHRVKRTFEIRFFTSSWAQVTSQHIRWGIAQTTFKQISTKHHLRWWDLLKLF